MDQVEMETLIRNIDARTKRIEERTTRIEQLLPTFVTKDDAKAFLTKDDAQKFASKEDLTAFATKDDFRAFATKDDFRAFATKDDLRAFATKDELRAFATKDDLRAFATKNDLTVFATQDDVRQEGERTRLHFDMVADQLTAEIALIAEGHKATTERVDRQLGEARATLTSHDKRIMRLEAKSMKSGGRPKR